MNDWSLDRPLLWLSQSDALDFNTLMQGSAVFGASGCGKSTGSLYALAMAFLSAGLGGLVLTVKPGEAETWKSYARLVNRERELIVVSPSDPQWRINLLRYECERPGAGSAQTENLSRLICTLSELSERGRGGAQNEGFWENAKQQLLRNIIEICLAARGTVSLADLHEVIRSAPHTPADLENEKWRESSFCFQSILAAEHRPLSIQQRKDFEHSAAFMIGELPYLADRTRSSIVSSVTGITDVFMRGVLRELFSTETTFIPEMCFQGAVIVLDLPVKEFGAVGRLGQTLVKLIWQRAMERRDVSRNPRPVFLFADEFQEFCVSEDRIFQATARSSRVCTVYATQNLPSLYASLGGGEIGRQNADALIGNLQTKILHANGDNITNEWASNMIAKSWQFRSSVGSSAQPSHEHRSLLRTHHDHSMNTSLSEQFDFDVTPQEFTQLQMGGPPDFASEAIVFRPGRRWELSGKNYLRVFFPQGIY